MNTHRHLITIFLFVVTFSVFSGTLTFSGIVTKVFDGDTVAIAVRELPPGENIKAIASPYTNKIFSGMPWTIKIRLHGIDAPEKGQAYSTKSKEYLRFLIFQKEVMIKTNGEISYDRLLAQIFLIPNKDDIGLKMIRNGMAWHYEYFDDNPQYAQAQFLAKQEKRGLWMDQAPVEPWKFRRAKKSQNNKKNPEDRQ